MAIHEVTTSDVLQRCEACEDEHRILIDDLEVGVARDQQVDGRLIPMPPCPACGAVEFSCERPMMGRSILRRARSGTSTACWSTSCTPTW